MASATNRDGNNLEEPFLKNSVIEPAPKYGSTGDSGKQGLQDGTNSISDLDIKTLRVVSVGILSALGSMLFGLDIGYIGPIIECASFQSDVLHVKGNGVVNSTTEGMIVSFFSIGAIATACPLVSSYFLDDWGRKPSIILGAIVFIIGSVIQGSATEATMFIFGRLVAGCSIGLLSSVVVLYQSELAPANARGALSTVYQLGIAFGILIAAYMDQIFVEDSHGWRAVMGIICIPAVLLLIGSTVLPRSPRWLVQKGRRREALEVLRSLRSNDDAEREEEEIFQECESAKTEGQISWSECCRGRVFKLLILGITLQLLQQLTGMNAFMYFGPKLFKSIGFSQNLFTTINNLVNFLASFLAIWLADIVGRRNLMVFSSAGMLIACLVIGATVAITSVVHEGNIEDGMVSGGVGGWIVVMSSFFFVANFAYGFGPMVWVYCAEIFPLRYRGRCVGICAMANWIGNFAIAQFTPLLFETLKFNMFFIFALMCTFGLALSLHLPETKGVSLEAIQRLFDDTPGFRK